MLEDVCHQPFFEADKIWIQKKKSNQNAQIYNQNLLGIYESEDIFVWNFPELGFINFE